MKLSKAVLACFCLLGATQLAWSQAKEPVAHPIAGFLDPATGKFTTRVTPTAAEPNAAAAATSVFFREDFQISVTNYDQKATSAVCVVTMSSSEFGYDETSSVAATATGSGFTCDVPVLTQWQLQNPSTDTITAEVGVYLFTPTTQTSAALAYPAGYRVSTQTLYSLTQPANGQTVVTKVNFSI